MLNKIIKLITSQPKIYDLCQLILEGDYSQIIIDTVKASAKEKILDIGCGTGYFSQFFNCWYTGIDSESGYINYAQKKYQNERRKFYLADGKKIDFSDKSFDKIILINIIHHLSDNDLKGILIEAKRLAQKEIFIFDMDKHRNTFLTPMLLAMDNGKFIRNIDEQIAIIKPILEIDKYFTFQAPRKLFTHSLIKCKVI